jgi:acetyltransferase-like isoleucine patch superfamily enzyme
LKAFLKNALGAAFLALAFPMAVWSGFGRLEAVFAFFAQGCALAPGLPGDYLRVAYYRLTLTRCAAESRIQFGSFFAHPDAEVGRGVYIGCHCILGRLTLGDRAQIASGVQVLSGGKQHPRGRDGRILGAEKGIFQRISIGADCWIGAASVVMADVGSQTTVGAGSVVAYPIPARCVAIGNPARIVRRMDEGAA